MMIIVSVCRAMARGAKRERTPESWTRKQCAVCGRRC